MFTSGGLHEMLEQLRCVIDMIIVLRFLQFVELMVCLIQLKDVLSQQQETLLQPSSCAYVKHGPETKGKVGAMTSTRAQGVCLSL